jgi:[protein-PII] uridylyltransferase
VSARGRDDGLDTDAFERALLGADSPLTVFRAALRDGRESLKQRYLDDPRLAPMLVESHARLVDELLAHAWRLHLPMAPKKVSLALVAVGGYGRGELHPASDVDILILLKKSGADDVLKFAECFVRFLWDMGLEIGHSVRTLKECTQQAKADVTVATNIMEARLLAGDAALFREMGKLTGPKKI